MTDQAQNRQLHCSCKQFNSKQQFMYEMYRFMTHKVLRNDVGKSDKAICHANTKILIVFANIFNFALNGRLNTIH